VTAEIAFSQKKWRAKMKKQSGVTVTLSDKVLREITEVIGTCINCGKPAQVATMRNGKFINICFDCSDTLGSKKPEKQLCPDCGGDCDTILAAMQKSLKGKRS
jgi:hypothetical protein